MGSVVGRVVRLLASAGRWPFGTVGADGRGMERSVGDKAAEVVAENLAGIIVVDVEVEVDRIISFIKIMMCSFSSEDTVVTTSISAIIIDMLAGFAVDEQLLEDIAINCITDAVSHIAVFGIKATTKLPNYFKCTCQPLVWPCGILARSGLGH